MHCFGCFLMLFLFQFLRHVELQVVRVAKLAALLEGQQGFLKYAEEAVSITKTTHGENSLLYAQLQSI
eukprot:m.119609 g.119609  ORF g.119609 m.119609 type:complete len:68 (-) comp12909_c0_seq22:1152-1355(-)